MATIAVVDDEEPILGLVHELLTDVGHRVLLHRTTADAEAMIAAVSPDLIFLDIAVESRDAGWHLLKRLRANPETATLPVIVSTADAVFVRERADDLAALGCALLTKPFDLDDLLALVAQLTGDARHHGEHARGGLMDRSFV
jgi:CheY-like chemotaxis protein